MFITWRCNLNEYCLADINLSIHHYQVKRSDTLLLTTAFFVDFYNKGEQGGREKIKEKKKRVNTDICQSMKGSPGMNM